MGKVSEMVRMKRQEKGFTLVELLVVIVIISLLAGWVAPNLFKHLRKAKHDIAKAKMANIEGALLRFYADCERYPYQSEGLEALVVAPGDLEEKWNGPSATRGSGADELMQDEKHPVLW